MLGVKQDALQRLLYVFCMFCVYLYIEHILNPHIASKGVKIPPQTDLFAVISERHGIKTIALVTFPKYVRAMKWHDTGKSITIHKFKMAASKPDI